MPFNMKNVTNTFSKTMGEVFKEYMDKFLVFVDEFNIHNLTWANHL